MTGPGVVIPPSAVAAALSMWEEYGQAGASPEEAMAEALRAGLAAMGETTTQYGTRYAEPDEEPSVVRRVDRDDALRVSTRGRTPVQCTVIVMPWEPIPDEETDRV